jgi:hypothetical protein
MTVKEFKSSADTKGNIQYRDINGKDISDKPEIILDLLTVIGSSHYTDGTIIVDVDYVD